MRYALDMIRDLCDELGLGAVARSSHELAVELEAGVVLLFVNAKLEEDSFVGFEGGEWHYHDDFMCSDRHGFHIELGYLDILMGLADGEVLLCEQWIRGELRERSLVHRDYVDEFRYLEEGEEIRIRRVSSPIGPVEKHCLTNGCKGTALRAVPDRQSR